MDHFERELARMMRDAQEHTPFGSEDRVRLRSGVLARRRARLAQRAVGCVLAVAGLGIGLHMLPQPRAENRPQAPVPRPAISPASPSPSLPPTSDVSPSGTAEGPSSPPSAPPTTGWPGTSYVPPPAPTTPSADSETPSPPAAPSSTPSSTPSSAPSTVGPPVSTDPG